MRYRIRPIDGALLAMAGVIVLACFVPLRGNKWTSAFAACVSIGILILLAWQAWRWITGKNRLPEDSRTRRPLRLILGLIPLGFLLMTEILDIVARHTFLFARASDSVIYSPTLCQEIGCPAHIGWPVKVSISETSDSGAGSIEIPLSGAKASATLFLEGTKKDGVWTVDKQYFTIGGAGQRTRVIPPVGQ